LIADALTGAAEEETKAMTYRFQRSGKKGARKPPDGICCDCSSRWGNPFDWKKLARAYALTPERARHMAVAMFEQALMAGELSFSVDDVRDELSDHPLGCYCPLGGPCHADVLLRVANCPCVQRALPDIDRSG
jgi:hypothetical protein